MWYDWADYCEGEPDPSPDWTPVWGWQLRLFLALLLAGFILVAWLHLVYGWQYRGYQAGQYVISVPGLVGPDQSWGPILLCP